MRSSDQQSNTYRLKAFIDKYLSGPELPREIVPEDFHLLIDGPFRGWECVTFGVQVSFLWRGASLDDCVRYALDGDVDLPFAGREQQMHDLMLATLRERTGDPALVARLVRVLAELHTRLRSTVNREIGVSSDCERCTGGIRV